MTGALAAEREAQGHALLGDQAACERALDLSAEWLAKEARRSEAPMQGTLTTPELRRWRAAGACSTLAGRRKPPT